MDLGQYVFTISTGIGRIGRKEIVITRIPNEDGFESSEIDKITTSIVRSIAKCVVGNDIL